MSTIALALPQRVILDWDRLSLWAEEGCYLIAASLLMIDVCLCVSSGVYRLVLCCCVAILWSHLAGYTACTSYSSGRTAPGDSMPGSLRPYRVGETVPYLLALRAMQ